MSSSSSSQDQKLTLTATAKSAPSQASGKLLVRVTEARNLLVKRAQPHLYCVVQFEGNEFVTKESVDVRVADGSTDQQLKTNVVWRHDAIFDVTRPDGEVLITIYDRLQKEDQFLGYIRIRPPRLNNKSTDNWFRLLPRQWKERVCGDMHIQLTFKAPSSQSERRALCADDFELLRVLGKGSFGKVFQVRKKDTGRIYAMKVLGKKDIIERKEVEHTMAERNILKLSNHPFLVGLKFAFQSPEKLYLVLDFMNGGELFHHLQQASSFDEERARFYAAEILLALEHLHKANIIYRDLKPENILLDSTGHVALTDFGLCKENMTPDSITKTFCGTAEYLAPEVLLGQGYGRAVDWWSLGILLYEMICGMPPFYAENHHAMYRKILYGEIAYPSSMSQLARSLIGALLDRDPKSRLGSGTGDAVEVKRHVFFGSINWDGLVKKQVPPPFKPAVESEMDTSNFDPNFTSQMPDSGPPNSAAVAVAAGSSKSGTGGGEKGGKRMSKNMSEGEFKGFTFNQETDFLQHGSSGGKKRSLDPHQ